MRRKLEKGSAELVLGVMVVALITLMLMLSQITSSRRMKSKMATFNSLAGEYTAEIVVIYSYIHYSVNGAALPGSPDSFGYNPSVNPGLPGSFLESEHRDILFSGLGLPFFTGLFPSAQANPSISPPPGTPVAGSVSLLNSASKTFLPRYQPGSLYFNFTPATGTTQYFCGKVRVPSSTTPVSSCIAITLVVPPPLVDDPAVILGQSFIDASQTSAVTFSGLAPMSGFPYAWGTMPGIPATSSGVSLQIINPNSTNVLWPADDPLLMPSATSFTLATPSDVLITYSAEENHSGAANICYASLYIDGVNQTSAGTYAPHTRHTSGKFHFVAKGLAAGPHTVDIRYSPDKGSCTWTSRDLAVMTMTGPSLYVAANELTPSPSATVLPTPETLDFSVPAGGTNALFFYSANVTHVSSPGNVVFDCVSQLQVDGAVAVTHKVSGKPAIQMSESELSYYFGNLAEGNHNVTVLHSTTANGKCSWDHRQLYVLNRPPMLDPAPPGTFTTPSIYASTAGAGNTTVSGGTWTTFGDDLTFTLNNAGSGAQMLIGYDSQVTHTGTNNCSTQLMIDGNPIFSTDSYNTAGLSEEQGFTHEANLKKGAHTIQVRHQTSNGNKCTWSDTNFYAHRTAQPHAATQPVEVYVSQPNRYDGSTANDCNYIVDATGLASSIGCGAFFNWGKNLTLPYDTTPGACNTVRHIMTKPPWPSSGPLTPTPGPIAQGALGAIRSTNAGDMPYYNMYKSGTSMNFEINDNTDSTSIFDYHHYADAVFSLTFPTGRYTIENSSTTPCN